MRRTASVSLPCRAGMSIIRIEKTIIKTEMSIKSFRIQSYIPSFINQKLIIVCFLQVLTTAGFFMKIYKLYTSPSHQNSFDYHRNTLITVLYYLLKSLFGCFKIAFHQISGNCFLRNPEDEGN